MDPLSPFIPPAESKEKIDKAKKKSSPIQEKAQKQIKGHEVEDMIGTRAKLMRKASVSDFKSRSTKETGLFEKSVPVKKTLREGIEKADKEVLSEKSSALWECVGRKPDKSGGYIYMFRLKDKYDDVTAVPEAEQMKRMEAIANKIQKISPAIEFPGSAIKDLFPNIGNKITVEKLHIDEGMEPEDLDMMEILGALGYGSEVKDDGMYMYLPDKKVLETHWEKIGEKYKEAQAHREKLGEKVTDWPELNIVSGAGIAGDMDFVEANITHDALLSEGKEFVHDHIAHILATIQAKLDANKEAKTNLVKLIFDGYRRIMIAQREIKEGTLNIPKKQLDLINKNMEKMQAGLGAFVDFTSNVPIVSKDDLNQHFFEIWDDPQMGDYWKKRFGSVDNVELSKTWKQIEQIVNQFDSVREKWKPKP